MTRFESLVLFICILISVILIQICWSYQSPIDEIAGIISGFTIGAISTIIVLLIQRLESKRNLAREYDQYSGTYKRTRQGESQIKIPITKNKITLVHIPNTCSYSGTVQYDSGDAKFLIEFNKTNNLIGLGVFQYVSGLDHVGTYKVQRDMDIKSKLYVYYENTLPDNKVTGYEVWERE